MQEMRAKVTVAALAAAFLWFAASALHWLRKPAPNGCVMTYMYPTYIPVPAPANASSDKYGLFLYHEGWQKIDFEEHLRKLDGFPVLFIPGNGGSYKQVRSLAAESSRAYQNGPPEPSFYREAGFFPLEALGNTISEGLDDFAMPSQYTRRLDWFSVDLEEEHSAMDGRILEEHTEYVVYAIHRILNHYQDSYGSHKEGAEVPVKLPTSVILVGHSMGGFVARAALIHPKLRKSAVETILTLASPHQSPPIALQPSLGNLYSLVNEEWRKGYEAQITHAGLLSSSSALSRVVVISISGGIHDYQVRSKLATLDGIVPNTHGFMISSSSMKNVWLSMEHQTILWCNQLVVQISHTLLSLTNSQEAQPFPSTQKRLLVFSKMFRSAIPPTFKWVTHIQSSMEKDNPMKNAKISKGYPTLDFSCPPSVLWTNNDLEKDLYIQSTSVTILAMDGKRRWLDIRKLGSDGKGHFVLVTNLLPCSGVRIHLWPEKSNELSDVVPAAKRILEVTSKLVRVPAGPAPRQIEPGSQTEQAPPSAMLLLSPEEMHGYRFLTIAVASSPTVSGRPPPASTMAVGQFFDPDEGERILSPSLLLRSIFAEEEIFFKENHPLALNLSFSLSFGLFPVTLSLRATGCGIKTSDEQVGDVDHSALCKLRCFPPVALASDALSGLHIVPNLYSETILVDSSPASWGSRHDSERTNVLLLADPHCSYRVKVSISMAAATSRFFLLYTSQIIGFMVSVIFFALMRQARAWELDLSMPSILTAMERNLRFPLSFIALVVAPTLVSWGFSLHAGQQMPPVTLFAIVSIVCYLMANGCLISLVLIFHLIFYAAAITQVFIKRSWKKWEEKFQFSFLQHFFGFCSVLHSKKAVHVLRGHPNFVVALITILLVIFVHPALGLMLLIISHSLRCHAALYRSHAMYPHSSKAGDNEEIVPPMSLGENGASSPSSAKSFRDSQLECFNYHHGLLILHLLAGLMFAPSLVAWLQRIGTSQSFPGIIDSSLCIGVIFHGLCGAKPDIASISFPLPGIVASRDLGLSSVYLLSGYFAFASAIAMAPYRSFYAMAALGTISLAARVMDWRSRERGGDGSRRKRRRHSHKQ